MKIKDIIEIEKHFTKNKKTPCDIVKFLEDETYSKSRGEDIKHGDMHLTHYIRHQLYNERQFSWSEAEGIETIRYLRKQLRDYKQAMEKLKPLITQLGRL